MKKILFLSLIILTCLGCLAEQWRLHPTFDGQLKQIVDTPDFTYFTSYNQPYLPTVNQISTPNLALFRYDKKGEEVMPLTVENLLSDHNVSLIRYNNEGKYLVVVYLNGNVDIIYDNGTVENIPGLKLADSGFSKIVNNINFDNSNSEIYLSTDFGFVTLDQKKGEVKYSRNLKTKVTSVARLLHKMVVGTETGLYETSPNGHEELSEMPVIEGIANVIDIVKFAEKLFVLNGKEFDKKLPLIGLEGGKLVKYDWFVADIYKIEPVKDGMRMYASYRIWDVKPNLDATLYWIDEVDCNRICSSWDGKEFWFDYQRDGLRRKKANVTDNGNSWTTTIEKIFPNCANPFRVTDMVWHSKYGLLVRNHGVSPVLNSHQEPSPDLICAYRSGVWTPMSATYRIKDDTFLQWNPGGIAVDPDNPEHVYSGSVIHGLVRLDLEDPTKSLRFARKGDYANGRKQFIEVQEDSKKWSEVSIFGAPKFDAYGNLWTCTFNYDEDRDDKVQMCVWSPADRKSTVDASTYKPFTRFRVKGIRSAAAGSVLPLKSNSSNNMVFYYTGGWEVPPCLINHNGTITDTSDDKVVVPTSLIDQDGSTVSFSYIKCAMEDTSTGLIWVGTSEGVFTIRPADFLSTGNRVNRVKVSRNDGTNLADYLLSGVTVNCITSDLSGKKWFGTIGGGIVVTSSDGTEILKTYTSENSQLPDNNIYGICYNPENNSMMISTDNGLAELFMSSQAASGEKSDVKAYPNPVRPDYFGYVTIEGLADNALVKIVDGGGNLIKELGFAAGGEARWDATNLNMKRVPTGVYYVLASSGPDEENYSAVTKIMVVK